MWSKMPGAQLIVRRTPPAIAVLGSFDAGGEARLKALEQQINIGIKSIRYVSYSQAEKDCHLLMAKLVKHFGQSELDRSCFVAIPRGGIIVLGILSYVMNLKKEQLDMPPSPDVPLIVVDDCTLTGHRFGSFLENCQSDKIVLAALYSHPDLRSAIKAEDPRILACLSAHDLVDACGDSENDKLAFRERWMARLGDRRYWIGRSEYICFAWNEPDRLFWNPVTYKVESGWHLLSPELCLKNTAESIPVSIQPDAKGPLCPAEKILYVCHESEVLIGNMQSGESIRLDGVGADIWKAIVKSGERDEIIEMILKDYEIDETSLRADLSDFIKDLLERGLLEESYAEC
ncbi:MAG: PqqD family protein [Methanothrix sp.]